MNDEPPVRLCCGQRHYGPQCPDGKVMCCLCFERFEVSQLNICEDGRPEDVCKPCALAEREMCRVKWEGSRVRLVCGLFDRWIIVPEFGRNDFAWSGSRWVPIGGPVQVCNFDTRSAAEGYATSLGFEVVD